MFYLRFVILGHRSNSLHLISAFYFLTDIPVMARQVNAILCSAVGSYSTTHCCLHDQSVHTAGIIYILFNFV